MTDSCTRNDLLRFDRAEAGGALGDLGTFIPLLLAMVHQCGLQFGPSLLAAGALNIVTGLAFGIPMPVQPMKAIATVAIAEGMNEAQILTAGACMTINTAVGFAIGWAVAAALQWGVFRIEPPPSDSSTV